MNGDSTGDARPRPRSVKGSGNGAPDAAGAASPSVFVERVELQARGVAAFVVLDRPAQLNALDWDTLRGLEDALRSLDEDPVVRAVFITGRGRAFSAGADLKTYLGFQDDEEAVDRFVGAFQRVFGMIREMAKPVVALVNGIAVAGGLELAISCDFVYAAESAVLGDGHLVYGQIGGGGGLTLLPRLIGPARARELLFSAKMLNAAEALEWGLVNAVHPDDGLRAAAIEFAEGVASRSSVAVASAKRVMNHVSQHDLDTGLGLERSAATRHNVTSLDAREGLRAFAEGRSPRFTGE